MDSRFLWLVSSAAVAAVVVFIVGVILTDLPGTFDACAGVIVSTDLCEPARLRRSIFGSFMTGSSILALAMVATAWMLTKSQRDKN